MMVDAPFTLDALTECVAGNSPSPLQIAGGGTHRPWPTNRDGQDARVLDMTDLVGITSYEPAECVITMLAGTPVREVAATLAAHGQSMPWDPSRASEDATIGGMVASGLSGPGRYRYGGVRDFVIGARVVDGRGRLIASGGQVVKNAAGFLTHHAIVGSAGRLCVIAEVSLKVFPKPEATCTLVGRAATAVEAWAAHERLRRSPLDLDALDLDGDAAMVLARLAGAADALPARVDRAARALGIRAEIVEGADEAGLWAAQSLASWADAATVVKVPCAPSHLLPLAEACGRLARWRASAGGAVLYLAVEDVLDTVGAMLVAHDRSGVVVGGAEMGRGLGMPTATVFGDRVGQTLDPDRRFR